MAWADHLEGALDEAIDWIAEHAPGLLADEAVNEAYREAIAKAVAEGKDAEDEAVVQAAQEAAEVDTTQGGNFGHYLNSWEWGVSAEDPTREQVLALMNW